ncbi:hypothetical protein E8E13_005963 [Curvularia kusanoi]|uniref:Uncharacterized protein n=1 Tax=Curvularia kusanoi TaxID=90978 RepID=A0A9P4TAK8_CURKU|nr:hypothetical protein E8E13_005963 [Curvularia kusanoi]
MDPSANSTRSSNRLNSALDVQTAASSGFSENASAINSPEVGSNAKASSSVGAISSSTPSSDDTVRPHSTVALPPANLTNTQYRSMMGAQKMQNALRPLIKVAKVKNNPESSRMAQGILQQQYQRAPALGAWVRNLEQSYCVSCEDQVALENCDVMQCCNRLICGDCARWQSQQLTKKRNIGCFACEG